MLLLMTIIFLDVSFLPAMSSNIRKHTAQPRFISACAFPESDQNNDLEYFGQPRMQSIFMQTMNTDQTVQQHRLSIFTGCTRQKVSFLEFSWLLTAAHILFFSLSFRQSSVSCLCCDLL